MPRFHSDLSLEPLTRETPPEYCPNGGSSGVLAGAFHAVCLPERLSAGVSFLSVAAAPGYFSR